MYTPGKGGKPNLDWEAAKKKLREAYLIGASDEEACLYADIGVSTLYKYQKKDPEFVEQKALWKKNPILLAKQNIFTDISKQKNINTSKWYLEKYDREASDKEDQPSLGAPKNEREAELLLFIMNRHHDYRRSKDTKGLPDRDSGE